MKDKEHILDDARNLEPDPPRSKLDEYADIVWELRRKRKRICTITAFLNQRGVRVGKSTVGRWLKAHPVPKSKAPEERSHSSAGSSQQRSRIEDAARDFFRPSNSNHEHHEHQEPWNRPD